MSAKRQNEGTAEDRARKARLVIVAESRTYEEDAERVAQNMREYDPEREVIIVRGEASLTSRGATHEKAEEDLMLRMGSDGVYLQRGKLVLRGEFDDMKGRLKPNNLGSEMVVKAAKPGKKNKQKAGEREDGNTVPSAIDMTAGLGEDSLLLAAAGFSVDLYEYNPVIAALLRAAVARAAARPELSAAAGRMRVHEADSVKTFLHAGARGQTGGIQHETPGRPGVVLLDPMFPARRKSSLVKKKFQLLHELEMPCAEEEKLVEAAMAACPRKIIIKRPLKAPALAGMTPDYSIMGKNIRYDCVVLPSR